MTLIRETHFFPFSCSYLSHLYRRFYDTLFIRINLNFTTQVLSFYWVLKTLFVDKTPGYEKNCKPMYFYGPRTSILVRRLTECIARTDTQVQQFKRFRRHRQRGLQAIRVKGWVIKRGLYFTSRGCTC